MELTLEEAGRLYYQGQRLSLAKEPGNDFWADRMGLA